LTQQLLTFAKGGEPIKRAVSIATLLKDTIDFALSGSNVRCEHDLPEDLWSVEADEGQIGQVIQNVILNADQAMPGGGVVRVRAENVTITEHDPLPLEPGHHVKVSIVDQGIGIPEEHLHKIYDPFFTTKQKGSGLGLSSSFSIVKRHKGALRVESRLGGGTKVHIYLPALPEGRATRDAKGDASYRGEERVLLDHSENVRSAALEALLEISRLRPEPISISPATLLSHCLFDWTVSSGNTPRIFRFLAELGTTEADEAIEAIMEGPVEQLRNEDFEKFMCALAENGKRETVKRLSNRKISTTKNKILRGILEES